jgi:hypothetical protein
LIQKRKGISRTLYEQYMVVHAYNPNYSGGRDRRIVSLRPAWAKVAERPCLKNKIKTKVLEHSLSGREIA